jgi:hypothetical protein
VGYTDDSALPEITDATMRARLATTVPYTLIVLKHGPRYSPPGPDGARDPEIANLIWEHGRRNFKLRAAGLLQVVCPVMDTTEVAGICLFAASPEDADRIYSRDPAVRAGVLVYEIHPTRGFPGSTLTAWTESQ